MTGASPIRLTILSGPAQRDQHCVIDEPDHGLVEAPPEDGGVLLFHGLRSLCGRLRAGWCCLAEAGAELFEIRHQFPRGGVACFGAFLQTAAHDGFEAGGRDRPALGSWALVSSDAAANNYGFWWPGKEDDGGRPYMHSYP
jgi:hypothetical protein